MKIFDLDRWEEIWATIMRNKWRSFMTSMGVFWGIFMLVILLGAGLGLQRGLSSAITMSTNSAIFFVNQTSIPYKGLPMVRNWNANFYDVEKIMEDIEGVEYLSRYVDTQWGIKAVKDGKSTNTSLKGFEPEQMSIDPLIILHGRYINELDMRNSRKSCTLGENVYKSLFPMGGNPCGDVILIGSNQFTIIGIHKNLSDNGMSGNSSNEVYIPLTTMQRIYNYGEDITGFMITAKSGHSIVDIQEQIEYRLRQLYTIAPEDKKAIIVYNFEEMFMVFENLFLGINILTWIVGIGTLLAGVIGISNIMLIVIKERTQEIGVRRALGAKPSDIISQIMSESFVLTFITGVAALASGVGVLSLTENILAQSGGETPISPQISFNIAITAAIIVVASGLLAGVIPTIRAIKIKAVDAIREE